MFGSCGQACASRPCNPTKPRSEPQAADCVAQTVVNTSAFGAATKKNNRWVLVRDFFQLSLCLMQHLKNFLGTIPSGTFEPCPLSPPLNRHKYWVPCYSPTSPIDL